MNEHDTNVWERVADAAQEAAAWLAGRVATVAHGRRARLALYLLAGLTVAVAALIGFLALGRIIQTVGALKFDDWVLTHAGELRTAGRTRLMVEFSALGTARFLVPALAAATAVLLLAGPRLPVALLWAAVIGGHALNFVLKMVYHRPRPTIITWDVSATSTSFPSGHAMAALISYGAIALFVGRVVPWFVPRVALWAAALSIALMVGISRVYLGVHYATDVIAGYAVGVAWLAFVASALPAARLFGHTDA